MNDRQTQRDLQNEVQGAKGIHASPWPIATTAATLQIAGIFVAAFWYLWYLQSLSPSMPDNDPYYHIKMAALFREHGILASFPWARFSLWSEHFFDKDLLFHLLLMPFASGDLESSMKLAAALFGAAAIASFYWALLALGVGSPLLYTALLAAEGSSWWARLVVLRGYLLSIVFCMCGVAFIMRGRSRALFVVSALYVLAYNSFFLLPVWAVLWMIVFMRAPERTPKNSVPVWEIPLASIGGVLLGLCVHPHLSAAWSNLIVQNFEVLLASWSPPPGLNPAAELSAMSTRDLIAFNPILIAATLATWVALVMRGRIPGARVQFTLIVATTSLLFTLLSQRFIEYWAPFQILCLAMVMAEGTDSRMARVPRALGRVARALAVVALLATAWTLHSPLREYYRRVSVPAAQSAALWLRENVPAGEGIFTCDWDDAAILLFYDGLHPYLVFGDPLYLYGWNEALWHQWRKVTSGSESDFARVVRTRFGSRFVYCTQDFRPFLAQLGESESAELRFTGKGDTIWEILSSSTDSESADGKQG